MLGKACLQTQKDLNKKIRKDRLQKIDPGSSYLTLILSDLKRSLKIL